MATKLDTDTIVARYTKQQSKLASIDGAVAKAQETIRLAGPNRDEISAKLAMYRAQLTAKGFDLTKLDAEIESEDVNTDVDTEDDEDLDAA